MQPAAKTNTRQLRLDIKLERVIWRYRLITLVPVVMSLVGCVSCCIVGTNAEIAAIGKGLSRKINRGNANLAISKVMSGINFY